MPCNDNAAEIVVDSKVFLLILEPDAVDFKYAFTEPNVHHSIMVFSHNIFLSESGYLRYKFLVSYKFMV